MKYQGNPANEPGNVTEVYFQVYIRFTATYSTFNDVNPNRNHPQQTEIEISPIELSPASPRICRYRVIKGMRQNLLRGGIFMDANNMEKGNAPRLSP